MSEPKVYDKADLMIVFAEDTDTARPIGTFNSVKREGQGDLFADVRRTHHVHALTRVMFSDKFRFAVVEQYITVSEGGRGYLPKDHPYRDESLPRLTLLRGAVCHNSAELAREIVRLADEWRAEMGTHVPEGIVGDEPARDLSSVVIESVVDQINAGALDTNGAKVTATIRKAAR